MRVTQSHYVHEYVEHVYTTLGSGRCHLFDVVEDVLHLLPTLNMICCALCQVFVNNKCSSFIVILAYCLMTYSYTGRFIVIGSSSGKKEVCDKDISRLLGHDDPLRPNILQ